MKRIVRFVTEVEVHIDEAKFTPAFMEEFRKVFYPFQTLEDHLLHLGQLYARGIADDHAFIEGYGRADDMGIFFKEIASEVE
jgi:hypothetical protein